MTEKTIKVTDNEVPLRQTPKVKPVTISTIHIPIDYVPTLKLANASALQLLYFYAHRLENQVPEENNKWQQLAYPELTKLFVDLRDRVTAQVADLASKYDKDVVMINFCGYKNFKLPTMVPIDGVNIRMTYAYANAKHVIKTLNQRLTYLSLTYLPTRYTDDENKISAFKKVRELASKIKSEEIQKALETWEDIRRRADIAADIKRDYSSKNTNYRRHYEKYRNDSNRKDRVVARK